MFRSHEEVSWRASTYKKSKAPVRKLRLALITLPILFVIWVGFLLYSPYFHITKVNYFGLRVTKAEELKDIVEGKLLKGGSILPKNDYFIVNEASIAKELEKAFSLKKVTVTKTFPDTLEIVIEEKISSIIYDNGKKYFLLDESGTVQRFLKDVDSKENELQTPSAPVGVTANTTTAALLATLLAGTTTTVQTPENNFIHTPNYATIRREYGGYPLIYNNTKPDIQVEQTNVLTAKKIKGIIDMYSAVENSGLARIRYMEIGDPAAGVIIHSNQPWEIYFEANDDIEAQYNHIKLILKDTKPKERIDVRYGDRVFVK